MAGEPRTEATASKAKAKRVHGVVIGRLVRGGDRAECLVDYPGNPTDGPLGATATVASTDTDVGREVALAFESGDPERPIVLGFIEHPAGVGEEPEASQPSEPLKVTADGERVEVSAEREIVLRCGKASLTLTRAGKILIRGRYVLSRSSGVNRIKGGSVQIN